MQEQLNNSLNVVIKILPNKIIYDFKIKKALLLFHNNNLVRDDIVNKRLEYRTKIANATTFANAKTKIYYDVRHTLLMLKLDDRAYLRLNYDYHLLDKLSKKILF